MIKAFLCPITVPPAAGDPASQRGTAQGDPDRRNDPANAQQTTTVDNDGGAASSVPTPTSTFDLDGTNECDYCKIFESLFGVPRINVMNGSVSHAAPPINLKAGLAAAFHDDLLILHSFFQRIAQEFYGKQFMVKLPMVRTYLDRNVYIIDEGYSSSLLFNNGTMRIMEGDGKIYSNYKISPQGAWEEAGNMIDDQIVIGGWYSNIFQNDQGLIEPILGFWSSMGFDYESYFICRLLQENNGQRVDPERSKGALFKIGDMVHAPRVCIDTIAGTSSTDTTDGSPLTPAPDPRTKPLRHGSDNHETPGT
jgi:hypothetical protein